MKILNLESFPVTDGKQSQFETARKLASAIAESDPCMPLTVRISIAA
jgi:hypothetical protein